MKIDWARKLTSRKFWIAVVGVVSGLLMIFKVDADMVDKISGVIMEAASAAAYLIAEGLADAANAPKPVEETGKHEPIYGDMIEDKE